MKTAVQLSGQIRNAKECYESVKAAVLDPFQADVFIDTWLPGRQMLDHRGNLLPDDVTLDELIRMYRPQEMSLQEFDSSETVSTIRRQTPDARRAYDGSEALETRLENVMFMYYKIWRASQLRENYEKTNGFNYGRVIRMRFDLTLERLPDFQPEPDTVFIPEGSNHRGGVGDLLAIGDSSSMSRYCDLFPLLNVYARLGFGLHPESILRTHLEHQQIRIKRFPLKYWLRGSLVR